MKITTPEKNLAADLTALAISLFIHGALVLGLTLVTLSDVPTEAREEPVFVDIIDLPPASKKGEEPEKPTAFSHRAQKVEKETVVVPGKILSKPVKPSIKTEGGEKEAPELKPAKEVLGEEPDKTAAVVPPVPIIPDIDEVIKEARPEKAPAEEHTEDVLIPEMPEAIEPSTPPEEGPDKLKLFPTDERLMELSKKYYEEEPEREKGKVLTLNTSELKYSKYLLNLKRRIEFFWDYPPSSIRKGEQGKLRINFTISNDGELESVEVVKSSNYPPLDDAAVTAIRLAAPFNPFPEDFDIEEIDIHGNFEYTIFYPMDRLGPGR